MKYEEKYNELVELSHSENSEIKEKADAWLIGIGLQGAAELKVSAFLLDLAIRNVKGEITRDEVSQLLNTHYANIPKTEVIARFVLCTRSTIWRSRAISGRKCSIPA